VKQLPDGVAAGDGAATAPAARAATGATPSVFLDRLDRDEGEVLRAGLEHLRVPAMIRRGDTVFVKPNLTFPVYREGVMTRPECVEAVIGALQDCGARVVVGESDSGGYNRFSMDEVFAKTGLAGIAARHGVPVVNLSHEPSRDIHVRWRGKDLAVPLPVRLLDDVDLFVTVPVPKVHANVGVSMSIKNQWGCIQEPSRRLELHPAFTEVIHAVNEALRVRISIIDGKFGLDRNGPMRGDPVRLGWMLMSDDIVAADVVCCRLMGVDPDQIGYLRYYRRRRGRSDVEAYRFNRDPHDLAGPRFRLRRDLLDYPGYFAFRSPALAYLAYHSPAAAFLHRVLYLFREKFYDHP
jgi:uncharacterized protein (DUF362 family)